MMFKAVTYCLANQSIKLSIRVMTVSKSNTSSVIGAVFGPTCIPNFSSTPPLIAYNNVFAKFARAPKNCICLPTTIGDTQHAIA